MRKNNARGQGLLETVVAIGIITAGLISVIALVISNLTTQREAALRYQAVNLAREAIELIRNTRDSNWLAGRADVWDRLRDMAGRGPVVLEVNPGGVVSFRLNPVGEPAIYQDADGVYRQGLGASGDVTPFSRTLRFDLLDCGSSTVLCDDIADPEKRVDLALSVTARVGWLSGGGTHQIEISEILYDWR